MPRLKLGLSAEKLTARRQGIGGSDAGKIMAGEWLALWEEKTGRAAPEDLSTVLPVQLGLCTEPLNLDWLERTLGVEITGEGETVSSPDHPFMRYTRDGLIRDYKGAKAVVQCKHVNQFAKLDDVVARYQPQCHHEMICEGADVAILSVFIGTMAHEWAEIERDFFYAAQLVDREREFWRYVETDEPPPQVGAVAAPAVPSAFREVDFEAAGHNEFGHHAGAWLANRGAASLFKNAEKDLKALVEPDVGHAFGFGISIRRSKAGALTIKETKHA